MHKTGIEPVFQGGFLWGLMGQICNPVANMSYYFTSGMNI